MYIATLIAAPGALDPALVLALRDAWGGGEAVWLAPDEAAEFSIQDVPGNRWEVWADLQAHAVDLVVQPAEGRRKKMLLADMDSTMIRQECIDELAEVAGVGAHVREITARAMNGELDFEGALLERVALLEGLDEAVIGEVLRDRISYMPGGAALVATMRAQGAYCALVSGGFTAFTQVVARISALTSTAPTRCWPTAAGFWAMSHAPSSGAPPRCRRWKRSARGWAFPRVT